jgi:phenylpyruvate tautomerase PptA (4-oxalocrotonate tautomerase family)
MPYIAVNTSQELSPALKEKLKAALGRLIAVIPTKNEAGLLVECSGGQTFFKAGKEVSGAFIDLRLFHKSETEPKKKFTEETFALFSGELGIKPENMYLTITEFEQWGSAGTLKS